jgi:DNA-binding transcriptional MerR regulator
VTPKLFRAVDVCELAQLQPYVLRSWEKEFPGIGVQKDAESPRLYRQTDVDQVLRIKQLVFSEGLTLAGARRRLEETVSRTPAEERQEVAEVLDALASDARTRIAHVRDGLRSILQLLSGAPGTVVVVDVPARASNGRGKAAANVRAMPARGKAVGKAARMKPMAQKTMAKASRAKIAKPKVVAKGSMKKRSRASA